MRILHKGFLSRKDVSPEIIFEVIDDLLVGVPTGFKLPEPRVLHCRSAKAEAAISVLSEPFDPLPHHKVCGPEILIRYIRSAEFIHGAVFEAEENGPGNGCFRVICKHDKTQVLRDDVLVNFAKERLGLWRHSMPFSRHAMQAVIFINGLRRREYINLDTFSSGLSDIPSRVALEPAKYLLGVRAEIQRVPVE